MKTPEMNNDEKDRLIGLLTVDQREALSFFVLALAEMKTSGMRANVIRLQANLMRQMPPTSARWN